MNDLIRLAQDAGAPDWWIGLGVDGVATGSALLWLERFAELAAAAERQRCQEYEAMAECMLMVRLELVSAGLVDKSVPPMMLPDAILSAHRAAVAKERASRRAAQCETVDLKERIARVGVEHRRALHEALQQEREACAQIVERNAAACVTHAMLRDILMSNAAAIRARTT